MKKKLSVMAIGLMVIGGLEASGLPIRYIDEIQQYLKMVISVYLASDATGDILKLLTQNLLSKDVKSSNVTD